MVPVSLIWLLLATGLLLLALAGADVDGLLPAVAVALVLSALTAWLPLPMVLQLGLLEGLTSLGILMMRRWSARQRHRSLPSAETATVLSGFSGSDAGRVRWHGQSWRAVNLGSSQALSPGMKVTVLGRDGNQLQVLGTGGD